MRILAVNQFYAPDQAATSQLLTQLCEDLVAGGDEVTVIASRGNYLGGGTLPSMEVRAGVEVVRPWSTRFGKATDLHRMSDYLTFWVSSVLRIAAEKRPDVVLALSTPPMIAAGAGLVAKTRGVPLVSWVQDVYPDAAVALETLGQAHPAVPVLRWLGAATQRMARVTVVLSEGMAKRLSPTEYRPGRVRVIPNWADGEVVYPIARGLNSFRGEHAEEGDFLVMYSGNLGRGHDVATLVDAARLLRGRDHIKFLFVGEGVRKKEAIRLAADIPNVQFLSYQPYDMLAQSLSAADVHLVSLRTGLEGLLVPSKLYGILAAGRPLAFVGPETSEVSRVIDKWKVGWVVRPGNSAALASVLENAAAHHADVDTMGQTARRVFIDNFARPHAVARWREVLREAVA